MTTTDYPPRHIPGFRPLVPGERWHRLDFTSDMLPDGWRPLMLGENQRPEDDELDCIGGIVHSTEVLDHGAADEDCHVRTRRPLPPPPPTFEHEGKTWKSHVPGDPCPVEQNARVEVLLFILDERYWTDSDIAREWNWNDQTHIIGYRLADEDQSADEPRETAKLKARVAELERELKQANHDLADEMRDHANLREHYDSAREEINTLTAELTSALTPRPIAEAKELREGFVRLFGQIDEDCPFMAYQDSHDTHFLDIHLPQTTERKQFEAEFPGYGDEAYQVWKKMKGGAA